MRTGRINRSFSNVLKSKSHTQLDLPLVIRRRKAQGLCWCKRRVPLEIEWARDIADYIIDRCVVCTIEDVESFGQQLNADFLIYPDALTKSKVHSKVIWANTGIAARACRSIVGGMMVAVYVASSQQVKRMPAVVANDRRELKIGPKASPWTLEYAGKYDFVPLIKAR
jgi:hypothetical protein